MNKLFLAITIGAVGLLIGIFMIANNNAGPSQSSDTVIENPHTIRDIDHVAGSREANVTLIEYGDFQCPACANAHPLLSQLKAEFGEQVAVVFRHFPLTSIHPHALAAGQAAEAAGRQDKFWQMHDLLFERQDEWSRSTAPQSFFNDYARELELNVDQFQRDMKDPAVTERINADLQIARQLGANSTPTFYLNGELMPNPATYEQLKSQIESQLPQGQ